jgi:hypothetical protein
MIKANNLYTN